MDNMMLYIVAITALAVAVFATLLITRLKKHIARLRDEVKRYVSELMWHENVLGSVKATLKSHTVMTPPSFTRMLDIALRSFPKEVKCPECNHKGAEWITIGCPNEGSALPVGIICPECESYLRSPFFDILDIDLGETEENTE